MSRGASTFRKRDLQTAVKAVRDAGVEVERVEIEKGRITIVTGKANGSEPEADGGKSEWDE